MRASFSAARDRGGAVARHLRGRHQRMHVVRIVGQRIDADRLLARDIGFIDDHRRLVGRHRRLVVADAVVDVERHVHEMAGARHGGGETPRIGQCPLRRGRRFHHVDVVVDGARMVRAAGQHFLETGDDLRRLALRLAGLPIIPGREIHQRLGVERQDVVVLRILRGEALHRRRVGRVERAPLRLRIVRVTLRDRGDQCLLARAGGRRVLLRLAHGGNRRRDGVGAPSAR